MPSPYQSLGVVEATSKTRTSFGEGYICHDIVSHNTYFTSAQDHIPLAYAVLNSFVSPTEIEELNQFFRFGKDASIKRTTFSGEDLDEGAAPPAGEPLVAQLYANPEPFKQNFPDLYERILSLKDSLGRKLGLPLRELEEVTFPQDIRHITYNQTDACPWHRDDPTNHFNTIMLLSQPGQDFLGGVLQFHPSSNPVSVDLQRGDAVIYSTPKMDHSVTAVTWGTRVICLVELKRASLVNQ